MKTLADLKRALTVGTVVTVTNHKYPELGGHRTVTKAQTKSVCLTLPADHPRAAEVNGPDGKGGSWFDYPKAKDLIANDDGTVTILHKEWKTDGVVPFMTIGITGIKCN